MSATASFGRPATPAPGVVAPELRVVRLRPHSRRLFWSALVLIAVTGAVGYFLGNLPAPFEDWMLLAAAGAIVLLLVVVPFLVWASRSYVVTTRRVIERSGFFGSRRTEFSHMRGYTVQLKRGPLQRMWRTGTLVLSNGVDTPLRLRNVPDAVLVSEVLGDQVEVNQIIAHRDAQSSSIPTQR